MRAFQLVAKHYFPAGRVNSRSFPSWLNVLIKSSQDVKVSRAIKRSTGWIITAGNSNSKEKNKLARGEGRQTGKRTNLLIGRTIFDELSEELDAIKSNYDVAAWNLCSDRSFSRWLVSHAGSMTVHNWTTVGPSWNIHEESMEYKSNRWFLQ